MGHLLPVGAEKRKFKREVIYSIRQLRGVGG